MPLDLQWIRLDPKLLRGWSKDAEALGDPASALLAELVSLERDPTLHMLMRAGKSARLLEGLLTGSQSRMAGELANEIEASARAMKR